MATRGDEVGAEPDRQLELELELELELIQPRMLYKSNARGEGTTDARALSLLAVFFSTPILNYGQDIQRRAGEQTW